MDEVQFKTRVAEIFANLDRYSYFDLLNITPEASFEEVRGAFHRMALSIHPDRHRQNSDGAFKDHVYAIYKRICEGYQVLSQPAARREYHQALARGERRLVRKQRQSSGPKRAEDGIQNVRAKKFFLMGQDAARRGDHKNARLNFRFACDLEPHPLIAERLAALDAAAEGVDAK